MDTIKLAEWHINGSSRIGIFEANITMASRSVRIESGTETQVNSTTITQQSYTYFTGERGCKRFELTNHLGNVLAVVTDKKVAICSTAVYAYWKAELVSATDYAPFGAPLAGKSYSSEAYRFGFNGQEKDNEVAGTGNITTAEFWEYDSRLGRRFNIDPRHFYWESPYSVMGDNPIVNTDIKGDKWKNGHEKEKKDAEAKVNEANSNLNSKQKQFDDKYKDVDPKSLNDKLKSEYESDKKGISKAKDELAQAEYELDLAKKKYEAVELIIKEFNKQLPDAYNFWDEDRAHRDIEVTVTNIPVSGGNLERGVHTSTGMFFELRIHPDWQVDKLSLNVEVLAHGLGHKFSYIIGKASGMDDDGEANADLYGRIIYGKLKNGINPRNYIDEFKD